MAAALPYLTQYNSTPSAPSLSQMDASQHTLPPFFYAFSVALCPISSCLVLASPHRIRSKSHARRWKQVHSWGSSVIFPS